MAEDMEATVDETDFNESAFSDAARAAKEKPADDVQDDVQDIQDEQVAEDDSATVADEVDDSGFEELLEQAQGLGLNVNDYKSEAALARGVLEHLQKQQPYVSYAQQLLPYADDIKSYFETIKQPRRPEPEPTPQTEEEWTAQRYFQEKYGGPGWKDDFNQAINSGLVQRDPETGMWVASPGQELAAGGILQELNRAQQHTSKFWQGLASKNPYEQFYDVLKEPILREVERRVEEIVGQREATTKQRDVVSDFETKHAFWMYATDPVSGQRVPTDAGREFFGTVSDLRENGISDPVKLLQLASKIHGIGSEAKEQPKAAVPSQQEPSQKQQSFLESARKRAQHTPSARQRGGDDVPQVVSEGDLESLFSRAYREAVSRK
jgi:hypothetical protein